ncbi:hypothetical protein B296_00024681, partial [Ensete ventricosum]
NDDRKDRRLWLWTLLTQSERTFITSNLIPRYMDPDEVDTVLAVFQIDTGSECSHPELDAEHQRLQTV